MTKILFDSLSFENSEFTSLLTNWTQFTFFFSEKSAKLGDRKIKVVI